MVTIYYLQKKTVLWESSCALSGYRGIFHCEINLAVVSRRFDEGKKPGRVYPL